MRLFAFWLFLLAVVPSIMAQEQPAAAPAGSLSQQPQFTSSQLEQLVAPIALYPDNLLAQVLAASTYPADVVTAARWLKRNPGLSEEDIKDELTVKNWDPSVQGLVFFPDLLAKMNDNLDWTQDLGEAFMSQQKDVMNTIQIMRRKAKDAGTLKSDANQQVTTATDGQTTIESTDPETVYVDNYVPSTAYGYWNGGGSWYYPQVIVAPAWPRAGYGAAWALGYRSDWNNGNISHYNNNYFANANRNYPANIANTPWNRNQVSPRGNTALNAGQVAQASQIAQQRPNTQQIAQQLGDGARNQLNRSAAAGNLNNIGRIPGGQQNLSNGLNAAQNGNLERDYSNRGYSSRAKSPCASNRSANMSRPSGNRGGSAAVSRGGGGGGGARGGGGGGRR